MMALHDISSPGQLDITKNTIEKLETTAICGLTSCCSWPVVTAWKLNFYGCSTSDYYFAKRKISLSSSIASNLVCSPMRLLALLWLVVCLISTLPQATRSFLTPPCGCSSPTSVNTVTPTDYYSPCGPHDRAALGGVNHRRRSPHRVTCTTSPPPPPPAVVVRGRHLLGGAALARSLFPPAPPPSSSSSLSSQMVGCGRSDGGDAASRRRRALLPCDARVVSGVLPNGLRWVAFPNSAPRGYFEAYLEVLTGSSDEVRDDSV